MKLSLAPLTYRMMRKGPRLFFPSELLQGSHFVPDLLYPSLHLPQNRLKRKLDIVGRHKGVSYLLTPHFLLHIALTCLRIWQHSSPGPDREEGQRTG